jgi:hypothetical protein
MTRPPAPPVDYAAERQRRQRWGNIKILIVVLVFALAALALSVTH